MDGSLMGGLPMPAIDWEQWQREHNLTQPAGAFAPGSLDLATPAGAGAPSPITLNQTTPAPLDASVDPSGMYVPPSAVPTKAQAESANPLRSFGSTLLPALVSPPPPAPVTPEPEAPPTPKAPVLAAAQAAMPPSGVDRNGTAPAVPPPAPPAAPAAPAPLADTQGPAGTPPSGDFYGSATPPPPTLAPVVEAAAKKYGVPLNVATWVGSHESGWNSAAVGIPTSSGRAQGAWQFMPGTAKQYNLADPTDFASSTDAAMHYLSDLAQKNGGDWEKAVQQYGTFSTGMGAQRDAAAQAGFHAYMGGKPDAVFATNSLAGETTAPATETPSPYTPLEMPFDPASLTMPRGSGLLALASGLLSGPNFSQGLGKGLQAMNNVTAQDLQGKREANTQTQAINSANYRNQYLQAMVGFKEAPKQFGQPILGSDGKTMLQPMRDGAGNVTYQPLPGTTTPQQRVNQAGDVDLAAAKAGAKTTATENARDIDEMLSDGAAAPVRQQQIDAAIRVLPTAGVGPGLASTKRAIANYFNIPIGETTPSSAQLAEAIDSQLRGSGIMGKNMRTQREFNTVMVGLPNMDQNPQTAAAVLNGVKNITSYKQKLHDDFLALPQEERTRMRGDQDAFQSWMAREGATFSHQMDSQGGVYAAPGSPALTAPNASSAPASAPPTAAPQGATSGTTRRGVTWVKNN